MGSSAVESNGRSEHTEELYREHRAAVAALCHSLLRDSVDAEDATQQVFLSAHRALVHGASPRDPRAWLLAVARHECYARFRQRAATPMPVGAAPDGATADASVSVLRSNELARVWDEVRRMPPAQREAFLLREIRGLSYDQLAAELSLSTPSVRSLLLRARTRLRRRLGDVIAALGGAPWVQVLVRALVGDGSSPVPAATKAVAVGLGALALTSGGDVPSVGHLASRPPRHAAEHHRVERRARPGAVTAASAAATPHRPKVGDGGAGHPIEREDRSGSRSGDSGSQSASPGGRDSGDDSVAVAISTQPTTSSGKDGGGDSSPSSGPDGSHDGSSVSSSSGPGPGPVTTTTTDSGSSGGSGGSGESGSGGDSHGG